MPAKSKAQYRLMQAAAKGQAKDGPSEAVAREFISKTPSAAFDRLPEKKKKSPGRGHGSRVIKD